MEINESEKTESLVAFRQILEHVTDGIVTFNETGIIDSVNPAITVLFHYTAEELIGKSIHEIIPQIQVTNDQTLASALLAFTEKPQEVQGRKKDSSLFICLLQISQMETVGKLKFTAIIHDISELRRVESALRVSENKINAIIQSAVDGVITINERGQIEMVNPAASKLFGYHPDELMGKSVNMLMPEPDKSRHDGYLHNYYRSGIGRIIGIGREVTGLRKNGTTFPFYLSISEVNLPDKRVFTGFIHDITNQKMAEEKLRRYAAELERSNRELQDFAYVSSHDLQEPLRKIQAFGDRLKAKEAEHLSDQGKDYIDRMLNAAFRMQRLINDLLSFSRVTTQSQPFIKVDLNILLREVLSDLEVMIDKTGARIEFETLPAIEAEAIQMRQLFQNLISNALKFRKEDEAPVIKISSKLIQRKAHLISTPGDEQVQIYVQDNGIGFDEKYLDRIFNVFQRLDGQKYEGSGIGLAICRKIAIRHGGDITARSEPGKGSVFIVTLALKQPKEAVS
ncbi:PAS domain S-box protein [Rhodocytophaga rosea]|uniref:Sensor protein FixL n=1 Tax=Rhodocytophaga rosea TaxID=2704465 RepID=A0A6C0GHS3_9BACT|nr:PAS domain-containing sensor histidine kinase [Rhodocytophaga rosea]QHT67611.1 PAS domain S-box protein [Rhodocytophaga rosea]